MAGRQFPDVAQHVTLFGGLSSGRGSFASLNASRMIVDFKQARITRRTRVTRFEQAASATVHPREAAARSKSSSTTVRTFARKKWKRRQEHPAIEAAGVIGIHDLVHCENVRAYVTLKDDASRPTSADYPIRPRARRLQSPRRDRDSRCYAAQRHRQRDRAALKQQAEGRVSVSDPAGRPNLPSRSVTRTPNAEPGTPSHLQATTPAAAECRWATRAGTATSRILIVRQRGSE